MSSYPSLESALKNVATAVERKLDQLLPVPEAREKALFEAMRYSLLAGGKRFRPFLVVTAADLFDVDKSCSFRAAAAIECVHTYSLVHDDLPAMDDDDMRRGQPTAHKVFGEAAAILAGDGLLTYAFEILSDPDTHNDPRVRCELVAALAKAAGIHGMVAGQMIDLASENSASDIGQVTRLQKLKTGALIACAAEMGAILGKANDARRQLLAAYAHDLGLAFQIADDLLDHEGSPEEAGKATQKDAERGKATFVSLLGPARARRQAEMLSKQAIGHLEDFGEKAALLRELARYVVNRRA
ncbi:MAG TPA: farnesyl diphosphate synthase [Sphingomonadales bacterium]|nr:farnesyl diphosphate synthase [Sphingomonadales bacterium]